MSSSGLECTVVAVPSALVYRAFGDGAGAGTAAITRRCLLRNHGASPAQFRLTLPSGGAFVVRGEAVAAATADTAEIPAGGTCSLAVEFTPPPSGDEHDASRLLFACTVYVTALYSGHALYHGVCIVYRLYSARVYSRAIQYTAYTLYSPIRRPSGAS